jgi:methionyl-tRNA formyltransferase
MNRITLTQIVEDPLEHMQPFGSHKTNGIVFFTNMGDDDCIRALKHLGNGECTVARDLESLRLAGGRILLCFSHSLIVPPDILEYYAGRAYNIHAASPDYPGRDPHHWAAYDGVTRYGATCHVMTERVDEGPIVDVELFDVLPTANPFKLLAQANDAAFHILERIGPRLQCGERLAPIGVNWNGKKRSRSDFKAMCRLDPNITREEFERIYRAFDGGAHDNLTIEIHGRTFRIDKAAQSH